MSLASYMLRDGTLFFLTNLIFNVAQIYLFTTQAFSIATISVTLGSVLTSRFILNLRLVGHENPLASGPSTVSANDLGSDARVTTLAFANIGATLEFDGDTEYDVGEVEDGEMNLSENTCEEMRAIELFSFKMPDNVSFYENQKVLFSIRHATLYSYNRQPALEDMWIETSSHLVANPFVSLLPGFDNGDGEKGLDIGLRYFSGCTVRSPNIDRALYIWESITDEDHEWHAEGVTDSLLARAYSCLAYAYFELHERARKGKAVERDDTLPSYHLLPTHRPDENLANDLLYLSAVYANASAAYGLTSSAVLYTDSPMDLWRVEEARTKEWQEEQRKKHAKAAKAPNAYVCATPGCGVQGNQKKALMRCAGRCPTERKPHYCSKECQKRDWKEHKLLCKPDDELKGEAPSGVPKAAVVDAPKLAADETNNIEWDVEMTKPSDGAERAIVIDIPGEEPLRLESRSLTPAVLRWMKGKAVEKAMGPDSR
ncbi:hypothetical protein BD311DRAFT_805996 [Dichomitus squalens]|uniref:MYND-type domain-containing protein n=1 Tax=Dichomitus squalens TaxID=114155 RepID=A0A4Q9MR69_9APHY|nr:hypothetical protein BD311DRAFT_805996 [Dichomitus squalens]